MPATEQTWRSQKLLHKIFAIGSLLLLVSTIWMFSKDHDRQWKGYQRVSRDIDNAYSNFDRARVEAEANEDELDYLKHQLLQVQGTRPEEKWVKKFIEEMAKGYRQQDFRQTGRENQLSDPPAPDPADLAAKIETEVAQITEAYQEIAPLPEEDFETDAARIAFYVTNRPKRDALLEEMGEILGRATFLEDNLLGERKFKAAELDAAKSVLDLAIRDDKPTAQPQERVDEVNAQLEILTLHYQQASDHRQALQDIIAEITDQERVLQKQIADNRAEMEQITKGIETRQSHWIEGYWFGKKLLESPIADAFNSPLKIENLWTEGLTHNYYNFKPVLRYDRCTTCHQAMEKTQAGSAVKPKYENVHDLTFTLATPDAEALAELLGEGSDADEVEGSVAAEEDDEASPEMTTVRLYGLDLASEGVLDRDDVTISYVRAKSRAAQARLTDDEAGVRYLATELIEASVSAAFETEGATRPQFGLAIGDVIVSINGDKILSEEDVRRKLLETVQWGQPVSIQVRRGYPHPYATHPRLDLFVGSTSPHTMQDLGCTVCHEGQGSATEFKWVSHYPNSLKQRDEWRKEYGWINNHHWIFPMYPNRFVEASCLKCHHDVTELEPSERFPEPPAPQLMAGYNTVRRYGCFGCHEVVGYDGPDKRVGPDLRLEPNYFAAGLQLAYSSQKRVRDFEKRAAQIQEKIAPLQSKIEALKTELADVEEQMKAEDATEGQIKTLESTRDELQQEIESLAAELEPHSTELAAVEANLLTLEQAIQRGKELGDRPYDDKTRARLRELVDDDQAAFLRYEKAIAEYEEIDEYLPAFGLEDYNTAAVLKDEEMPGKFRKVGPSLRYVDAKLDQPFLDDWIREPKSFRPSTRMPQFFRLFDHLKEVTENGEPHEKHGQGEGEQPDEFTHATGEKFDNQLKLHTAELEDIEIQGIREYLLRYSQPFDLVEGGEEAVEKAKQPGDVARGKVLFEVGGCLACHSNNDFPGHGDQGPDLTGMGSKLKGEQGRLWLYGWIQNPKRYHARTKMPVVTLKPLYTDDGSEQGTDPIADVVEYLLSSGSDWESLYDEDNVDVEALDELALKHLSKTFSVSFAERYLAEGIPESRRKTLKGAEVEILMAEELIAEGQQLSQEQKLLYIGSKSISKYGCYACHDIPGFEGAKPIGTALSDWGRKDPSKLAFEHINHYVGHGAHGGGHGHEESGDHDESHADPEDEAYFQHELHHHSRVGFIHQKLKEPRSYDYAKLENKPYNDRLKMPLFPLDHEQHEQVITFVLGLVADPPPKQFVFEPNERQIAINEGRKVLDRFNCAGCHELERAEWDITFPENWERLSDPQAPTTFPFLIPHVTQAEIEASTQVSHSGRLQATLSGRVKRNSRGELDIYAYDQLDEDYLPIGELDQDQYAIDALAYRFELYDPALIAGERYMPKDSLPVIPVDMVKQRSAAEGGDLSRYLLPRVLKLTTPANQSKGEEAWGWVAPSLVGQGKKTNPDWLHSFLLDPHPIRPAAMLNMPKFNMSPAEATRLVNYFSARAGAVYPYQFDPRKSAGHLALADSSYRQAHEQLAADQKKLFSGDRMDDVMRIVTSQAGCVKCHSIGDYEGTGDPRARGPNLSMVRNRLQPDYVRRWIAKPDYILPYTAMPVLIKYNPDNAKEDGFWDAVPGADPPELVPVYHGSGTEQLDALVDLLMNLDKYAESKASIAELVAPPPEGGEGADAAEAEAPAADTTGEGEAASE